MHEAPASVKDVQMQTFSTQSQQLRDTLVVLMSGNADTAAHDQLKKFLDDLHRAAVTLSVREAVFDMRELYFMNSSCLSLLLRLINSVVKSQSPAYKVRFRSNPNLRWQRRSLEAIRSFAREIVVVE
jgi:anti-anti-sigma factor